MLEWLVQTGGRVAGLLLRLTLAVVIFPHGAQKVLGWFGGHGSKNTLQFFTSSGIPTGFALLAIAAEFLGSLGLAVGFLTRVAAFGIACVMLVAIATVHWTHGFFMNWFGTQQGDGFESHLLALGIAIALMIVGGGAWSVDRALAGTATRELASAPAEVALMTGASHIARTQTTIQERRPHDATQHRSLRRTTAGCHPDADASAVR